LTCTGLVYGLLLWLQDITRRWSDPVSFLIPMASIAAIWCVVTWEARDELRHPNALPISAFFAVLAPGLFLGLLDAMRDPGVMRFLYEIVGALARTLSHLGRIGWLLLPAAYAGAALCRRKHRIRPRTDLWFWTLITAVGAAVWLQPERGLFFQSERPLPDQLWTVGAAAVSGLLIGWRFSKTGYPPAR
jgi:hypothetical protein